MSYVTREFSKNACPACLMYPRDLSTCPCKTKYEIKYVAETFASKLFFLFSRKSRNAANEDIDKTDISFSLIPLNQISGKNENH